MLSGRLRPPGKGTSARITCRRRWPKSRPCRTPTFAGISSAHCSQTRLKKSQHTSTWLHTLSRGKIARRLNDAAPCRHAPAAGLYPGANRRGTRANPALTRKMSQRSRQVRLPGCPRLTLTGPDVPAALVGRSATQRRYFPDCSCFAALCSAGHDLDTLSMGMTGDLESAVAEGSTCLRIGTAIFGPRE